MYGLDEAAMAYVLAAERLFEPDGAFISNQSAVVTLFVSMIFQSLEISIKHVGIESGLFTLKEARRRENRSGHGIKELALLAVERLGGNPFHPVIMAMTFANKDDYSYDVIKAMICGVAWKRQGILMQPDNWGMVKYAKETLLLFIRSLIGLIPLNKRL